MVCISGPTPIEHVEPVEPAEDDLGPPPPPPEATWQCEHCTFVNEPGVRVCVVCCRTPTTAAKIVPQTNGTTEAMTRLTIVDNTSMRTNDSRKKQSELICKKLIGFIILS